MESLAQPPLFRNRSYLLEIEVRGRQLTRNANQPAEYTSCALGIPRLHILLPRLPHLPRLPSPRQSKLPISKRPSTDGSVHSEPSNTCPGFDAISRTPQRDAQDKIKGYPKWGPGVKLLLNLRGFPRRTHADTLSREHDTSYGPSKWSGSGPSSTTLR